MLLVFLLAMTHGYPPAKYRFLDEYSPAMYRGNRGKQGTLPYFWLTEGLIKGQEFRLA